MIAKNSDSSNSNSTSSVRSVLNRNRRQRVRSCQPKGNSMVKYCFSDFFGKIQGTGMRPLSAQFKEDLKHLKFTKKEGRQGRLYSIGEGSFGKVFSLNLKGNKVKYVMKVTAFPSENERLIFENEAKIGFTPGINKVGTKCHGVQYVDYSILHKFGMIQTMENKGNVVQLGGGLQIHEHFLKGNTTKSSMSLQDYLIDFYKTTCPPTNHRLFKLLKKSLKLFYKITKGYHGDLHGGNIHVVLNTKNGLSSSVHNVIIGDYGAHTKFRTKNNDLLNNACLIDVFRLIKKEFSENLMSPNVDLIHNWPEGSNIKTIHQQNKQPRRSNLNMLKKLNYTTEDGLVRKRKNNGIFMRKSLMNSLLNGMPNKVKRRRVNI